MPREVKTQGRGGKVARGRGQPALTGQAEHSGERRTRQILDHVEIRTPSRKKGSGLPTYKNTARFNTDGDAAGPAEDGDTAGLADNDGAAGPEDDTPRLDKDDTRRVTRARYKAQHKDHRSDSGEPHLHSPERENGEGEGEGEHRDKAEEEEEEDGNDDQHASSKYRPSMDDWAHTSDDDGLTAGRLAEELPQVRGSSPLPFQVPQGPAHTQTAVQDARDPSPEAQDPSPSLPRPSRHAPRHASPPPPRHASPPPPRHVPHPPHPDAHTKVAPHAQQPAPLTKKGPRRKTAAQGAQDPSLLPSQPLRHAPRHPSPPPPPRHPSPPPPHHASSPPPQPPRHVPHPPHPDAHTKVAPHAQQPAPLTKKGPRRKTAAQGAQDPSLLPSQPLHHAPRHPSPPPPPRHPSSPPPQPPRHAPHLLHPGPHTKVAPHAQQPAPLTKKGPRRKTAAQGAQDPSLLPSQPLRHLSPPPPRHPSPPPPQPPRHVLHPPHLVPHTKAAPNQKAIKHSHQPAPPTKTAAQGMQGASARGQDTSPPPPQPPRHALHPPHPVPHTRTAPNTKAVKHAQQSALPMKMAVQSMLSDGLEYWPPSPRFSAVPEEEGVDASTSQELSAKAKGKQPAKKFRPLFDDDDIPITSGWSPRPEQSPHPQQEMSKRAKKRVHEVPEVGFPPQYHPSQKRLHLASLPQHISAHIELDVSAEEDGGAPDGDADVDGEERGEPAPRVWPLWSKLAQTNKGNFCVSKVGPKMHAFIDQLYKLNALTLWTRHSFPDSGGPCKVAYMQRMIREASTAFKEPILYDRYKEDPAWAGMISKALDTQISNVRAKAKQAAAQRVWASYGLGKADHQKRVEALLEGNRFIFPGNILGQIQFTKPYEHPIIGEILKECLVTPGKRSIMNSNLDAFAFPYEGEEDTRIGMIPETAICLVCTAIKFVLTQMKEGEYNPKLDFSAEACAQDWRSFLISFDKLHASSTSKWLTTLTHVFQMARHGNNPIAEEEVGQGIFDYMDVDGMAQDFQLID